jgi:predicted dehydrogenase
VANGSTSGVPEIWTAPGKPFNRKTDRMTRTFGVIGLGRMGYRTVLAGRQTGLEVVGILDSAPEPWGIGQEAGLAQHLSDDLQAFLARKPDIVAVSTTADSHAPLLQAVLDSGVRRVLMEKPIACSVAEAEGMIAAAEEAGARVLVNHNHRAWDVLARIRALDGDARFGALRAFIITQGAGGLGNLGTHYFDLANWLFGITPQAVAGFGTHPEAANPRGAQFDDIGGTVVVSYPGQRRLMLEIGDDIGAIGGYEFRFERGRVLMPFVSEPPRLYARREDVRDHPKHFYGAPLEELSFGDFAPADVVQGTAGVFQDLIAGTKTAGATLTEATTALEVMIAARLSIETGQVMTLPLTAEHRSRHYAVA